MESDPDTDPIYVTHAEDPTLGEDEMIIHTFVDPTSIQQDEGPCCTREINGTTVQAMHGADPSCRRLQSKDDE